MAVFITDECISCGVCEAECPRSCISFNGQIYEVDPMCCTECWEEGDGPSCAKVCPADCIFPLDKISVEKARNLAHEKLKRGKKLDPMLVRLGLLQKIEYSNVPTEGRKQQVPRKFFEG